MLLRSLRGRSGEPMQSGRVMLDDKERNMDQTLAAEKQFEALLNSWEDRYDEYMAALQGVPFADVSGKADLLRAADNKMTEIHGIEKQLREGYEMRAASGTSGLDSPAARRMYAAAQKVGWVDAPATHAYGIKLWCDYKVLPIVDWTRRQEAARHIAFALRNARQTDEAKVLEHLREAKRLIEE